MAERPHPHVPQLSAVPRGEARVTALELFFDLVFVLAITQCTTLMSAQPTWTGLARGLAVLTVLWWAWGGFAWLTSAVDPEEDGVRIVMFAAMAALVVVSLAVPGAFGGTAVLFAGAYAAVRITHIALFVVASSGDPAFRSSVLALAVSTGVAVAILVGASFADGRLQAALWIVAVLLDLLGPYFFGSEGWRIVPGHFAERHGLIVLIALGESIVAIGVGAGAHVDAGIVAAVVAGVAVASALWWLYFDVVAIVAERRLVRAAPGAEQNEIARDSYSYLHLPMVAGIVLLALGLKKTLAHVGDPLHAAPAAALVGGVALYLLAHVAFRARNVGGLSTRRVVAAALCVALYPVALAVPALVSLTLLALVLVGLIVYERLRFAEVRHRIRHAAAE